MKKFVTVLALLGVLLALQVPFAAAQEEPPYYEVQKGGETLRDIVENLQESYPGISADDLRAANENLVEAPDDQLLEAGTLLVIPVAAGQEPTDAQDPKGEEPPADEPPADQPPAEEVGPPELPKVEEPASEEPTEGKQAEEPEPALEEAPTLRDGSSDQEAETADDIDAQGSFNPGTGVSKIAVMNIDPGGPVGYSMLFYGQGGVDDTSTLASQGPLNYRGTSYYDLAVLSLAFGSGWIGSAVIEADREVFAVVDNSYSGGTYTGGDGFNGEAYEAPEPYTDIFLPYATNLGIYRFSRVTVQTTKASGTTDVTLSYKDQNGNDATCTNPTGFPVEAGRAVSFEPVFNCGGNTDNGSVRLTSSDPLVVVFDGSWGEQAGWKTAYSGIPATKASNTLYYPNIFRRVPDNEWVQWSNLFVQNVSNQPVQARISLYDTGAAMPSMQFTADIPALSAREFNTRFGGTGGNPSSDAFKVLGDLFAGTAIVEKISGPDNALVGVAHNFWGTTFFGGSTYTASSAGDAADTLFLPFATRKQPGGSWTEWDKGSVMNVTGSAVAVNIKYYNVAGAQLLEVGPCTIPNQSVESFNSRYGCDGVCCNASDLAALGDDFQGGIVVEGATGSKLIGIMNTLYPTRLNTFNAKATNR
jgi:hypothetical protein